MDFINVELTHLPGVSVRAQAAYGMVGEEWYPVTEAVPLNGGGYLPLLDIPMMSDERWRELCRSRFLEQYEAEYGVQSTFPEQAYREYNERLRRELSA